MQDKVRPKGYRGMTSERASFVKKRGHEIEQEFADLIGGKVYTKKGTRKKDVHDKSGDSHSVKSGEKKWQIFLYGRDRVAEDVDFPSGDGIVRCIDAFPASRAEYVADKDNFKRALQTEMIALRGALRAEGAVKAFLKKAFFNNGEVDYLTIRTAKEFLIFDSAEVIDVLSENLSAENSKAKRAGQFDDQKVVFKLPDGTTVGEIEMRNDSDVHYREVKFWMAIGKTTALLLEKLGPSLELKPGLRALGRASKTFEL